MNKLSEIMSDPSIPKNIREMVNNLSIDGKEALNSMYDENSKFFIHSNPVKIAERFFADPKKYPILYHYTDFNGLKGILTTKTFHIGSQYFMNDPEESIYVFNLAKNYLNKIHATSQEIEFFDYDFHRVKFDPYVWSFTYNDHSEALLAYGDFALEFSNQKLQECLTETLNPGVESLNQMNIGNSYVFPLKVEYNRRVQEEYVKVVMKTYLSAYRNIGIDNLDMYEIMKSCYYALTLFSLCFKNPLLYQEEEIRYVAFRRNDDNKLHPDKIINEKPWIIFPFASKLIEKIIYSRNIIKLESVEELLTKNGFDNSLLERTKLPYGRKNNQIS